MKNNVFNLLKILAITRRLFFLILMGLTLLVFVTLFAWSLTWSNTLLTICFWSRDIGLFFAIILLILFIFDWFSIKGESFIPYALLLTSYVLAWAATDWFTAYIAGRT
jgi:hypothetical protein